MACCYYRYITSKTKMKVKTTDIVARGTVTGSSTSHWKIKNMSHFVQNYSKILYINNNKLILKKAAHIKSGAK